MKESVTKFDLDAAFKALDEIPIPKVGRVRPNRIDDLHESVKRVDRTSALIEDYYNIQNQDEMEVAKEEIDADVARAKLARIEKIVDLDAKSEEDILPSYVGKIIIQCPQCMTLFYKKPEDIERSEENDELVNIGEECQHCGNDSGYMVIGKVAEEKVEEEPAEDIPEDDAAEEPEAELDVAEDEEVEGEEIEDNGTEDDLPPVEETQEEVEEEVKESLNEDIEDAEVEAEEILADGDVASEEEVEVEAEDVVAEEPAQEEVVEETPVEEEPVQEEEALFNAEEVKEIATEVAEEVVEANESEEAAEEQAAEIEEVVDAKVEDAVEKKSEEVVEEAPIDAESDAESEEIEESCDKLEECGPIEECGVQEDLKTEKKIDAFLDTIECVEKEDNKEEQILDEAKNVSNAEFSAMLNNPLYYKELKEAGELSDDVFDTLDELDENSINEVVSNYLNETYSNTENFTVTDCELKDNSLLIEGNILFKNGVSKHTAFTFNKEGNRLVGSNKHLAEGKAFVLRCVAKENKLIAESLYYNYNTSKKLVEGISLANHCKAIEE